MKTQYTPIIDHVFLKSGDKLLYGNYFFYRHKGNKCIFTFRIGSVPNTSKRRGGVGCYRHPRTLQELKNATDVNDGPPVRRKKSSIAVAWDDIPRQHTRSWKAHRGTQYKKT